MRLRAKRCRALCRLAFPDSSWRVSSVLILLEFSLQVAVVQKFVYHSCFVLETIVYDICSLILINFLIVKIYQAEEIIESRRSTR